MNDPLLNWTLLAQASPLQNFAREFQGRQTRLESGYLTTGLVIVLGVAVAVWLLSRVLERRDGRRPTDSSLSLFFTLCRAHRLRLSEWWLLWRVARDQKLKEPARLFLEPERLNPAHVNPVLRLRSAQLEALGARLFAGLSDEETPTPDRAPGDADGRMQAGGAGDPSPPIVPSAPGSEPDLPGWPSTTPSSQDLPPARPM